MKKTIPFLFLLFTIAGCNHKKHIPDVSSVKVAMRVERFEKDFFAIDTNHTEAALNQLSIKYSSHHVVASIAA